MGKFGNHIQSADWKKEKHVPVIEIKGQPQKGKTFEVRLMVGQEIPHPNTTEHHIRWIKLFFQPEGEKFTFHLGSFNFEAHGEGAKGPDQGPAKSEPSIVTPITLEKQGKLMALSYCNIHGLWEGEQEVGF